MEFHVILSRTNTSARNLCLHMGTCTVNSIKCVYCPAPPFVHLLLLAVANLDVSTDLHNCCTPLADRNI